VSFEVIRSEIIYHGAVFDLRQDSLRLPSGGLMKIDIVEHRGAVTIIPVDADGQIWFIRQYRHRSEQICWSYPRAWPSLTRIRRAALKGSCVKR